MVFEMVFEKVEVEKKSAKVAVQILRAIWSGAFQSGDRLPPERTMAKEMGVSRHVVREALSALQIVGIIESRPGDGTYVRRAINSSTLEAQVMAVLEENDDPFEVLEARRALEGGVMQIALTRLKAPDFAELEALLLRMREATAAKDLDAFLEADRLFHLTIAEAIQNPMIRRALLPLLGAMKQRLWKEMKRRYLFSRHAQVLLQLHERILNALRSRDREAVRQAVEDHFDTVEKYLK